MLKINKVVAAAALASLYPIAGSAQTTARGRNTGPFVEIAIRGSDVASFSDRIPYRITADPGTYVTVFRITPSGRVSVLNPYESALRGSKRTDILREFSAGYEDGRGYLVAVATRNNTSRRRLLSHTFDNLKWASMALGAESALDDLLTSVVPKSGDDLAAAWVTYRVERSSYAEGLGDYAFCPRFFESTFGRYPYFQNYDYYRGYAFDGLSTVSRERRYFEQTCYGRDPRAFFVRRPRASAPPTQPLDTARGAIGKMSPPAFRRPEPPALPPSRAGDPTATSTVFRVERPIPTPVQPDIRYPVVQMRMPVAPHPIPVDAQRRDPVTQPIIQSRAPDQPRPVPIEAPARAPVTQPMIRKYSPPPPPPPPPPAKS